ncbi:hypothetical protein D8B26_002703 [Coccidioides posadasii str. Silveira]|uniref:Uncharacterized protein n=1 Tax=Coccidioides posadasii RMSCC 3488 TaxID=454284 RepID=A0A0J6I5T2_COCPO|nr:hypothetical protein CPAG_03095 [Coccidioides posadasii RMSCC 3488]QVM08008.1 hypothetical protein D8B26_002703 [Coccidioides posadasii str. Silveira]
MMFLKTRFPRPAALFAGRLHSIYHVHSSSVNTPRPTTALPLAWYSGWTGSRPEDHSVNRSDRGDQTDPQTKATRAAWKEKKEGHAATDRTKSQATTEVNQKRGKTPEDEFPEAPRPIIGTTDERGRKGWE